MQTFSKIQTGKKTSDETKKLLSDIAKTQKRIPPNRKGEKMSKEGIEKMLKSRLENNKTNGRRKKILQYDIEGNLLKEWNYVNNIKVEGLNIKIESIRNVCNGYRNSVYGFIWKYKEITPNGPL